MEVLTFIIPFIVLITVVVFIHEYGHYYFARKFGVGVTDCLIEFAKLFAVIPKRIPTIKNIYPNKGFIF